MGERSHNGVVFALMRTDFSKARPICALLIDSDPVVCENWSAAVSGFEGDIESEVVSDWGEGGSVRLIGFSMWSFSRKSPGRMRIGNGFEARGVPGNQAVF